MVLALSSFIYFFDRMVVSSKIEMMFEYHATSLRDCRRKFCCCNSSMNEKLKPGWKKKQSTKLVTLVSRSHEFSLITTNESKTMEMCENFLDGKVKNFHLSVFKLMVQQITQFLNFNIQLYLWWFFTLGLSYFHEYLLIRMRILWFSILILTYVFLKKSIIIW